MRDYNMSFAQPDLFFAYDTMELMKREFPNDQLLMFGALMMKFLTEAIDEDVRAKYEEAHPRKARSGRPSFDPAFMLRVLLLQRFLGLTNVAMAGELRNNRKLAAVLGIRFISGLPTDKTIWLYHEWFRKAGIIVRLFGELTSKFEESLEPETAVAVDSSFNEAPKQHNTREENEAIKAGKGDELWKDNPHKKCHKDIDASYTKKHNKTYYGYKLHAKTGMKSKLLLTVFNTTAKVHDSQVVMPLFNWSDWGRKCYADSAYWRTAQMGYIEPEFHINTIVCDRGRRNHPWCEPQKEFHRGVSKIRARVEHPFGFIEQTMKGFKVRTVGKERAYYNGFMTSLVYNMARMGQIARYQPELIIDPEMAANLEVVKNG